MRTQILVTLEHGQTIDPVIDFIERINEVVNKDKEVPGARIIKTETYNA